MVLIVSKTQIPTNINTVTVYDLTVGNTLYEKWNVLCSLFILQNWWLVKWGQSSMWDMTWQRKVARTGFEPVTHWSGAEHLAALPKCHSEHCSNGDVMIVGQSGASSVHANIEMKRKMFQTGFEPANPLASSRLHYNKAPQVFMCLPGIFIRLAQGTIILPWL